MTESSSPLWVVTGPTAAGKSSVALEFAAQHGCEILSMDSMAIYQRMDIGTAKPSAGERARVRHHLLDLVPPSASFDTSRWCAAAAAAVADVRARGRTPLFVGGTPLYLMAFFKGLLEGPAADPVLREDLSAREAREPGSLHRELAQRDPEAAARIHVRDEKRLVRALEFLVKTGTPISARQTTFASGVWLRPCRTVALTRPRDELHARVKARTTAMLEAGLLDEVRAIRDSEGFSPQAAAGIGYRECLDFLAGRYKDREELRNMIRRNTHKLIRKQITWLRRLPEVMWRSPEEGVAGLEAALCGGG